MDNELIKVLYIDDEKEALFNFEQLFNDDFEIYTADSTEKGMEILASTDIQIIVSDQRMPHKTGIEFFSEIAQKYPNTIRILLTAYSEVTDIIDAINLGQVYQYITKPFETRNVKNILDKGAQHWRLKSENEALIAQLQHKKEEYVSINEELQHFNEELDASNKKIADLVERLSLSQEVSRSGSWDWDIQNNTFYWSEEFLKLFGMEPGTVAGFESWTKTLFPDDIELASKRIQDAIDNKTDLSQFYRIVLPNGNLRWIKAMGSATYHNDVPIRMVGLCIDVTDQKQAEQKVLESQAELRKALVFANQSRQTLLSVLEDQQIAQKKLNQLNDELEKRVIERTSQLEAANKELETFTYSVSHDLKAPLRGIDGYSQLLADLYAVDLNEEARKFITTIRSSTQQMNQLIEDLLQYSRLERSQIRNETINFRSLVNSILKINEDEITSRPISVVVDAPDTWLTVDSNGIQMALRNLIENAIKFTKRVPQPTILIKQEETVASWILSVKDNGIGFDMKYSQRIFEIFQRLHRAEDYSGTGIGLAMVSKAMHRMNGRVWAESSPGQGATFYLEIPKSI